MSSYFFIELYISRKHFTSNKKEQRLDVLKATKKHSDGFKSMYSFDFKET